MWLRGAVRSPEQWKGGDGLSPLGIVPGYDRLRGACRNVELLVRCTQCAVQLASRQSVAHFGYQSKIERVG